MASEKTYNPSDVAHKNGHFAGLPFTKETAKLVLLPVPWDVTVSSRSGTFSGPANILEASYQLDLADPLIPKAWELPIFMENPNPYWTKRNEELRPIAEKLIAAQEAGEDIKGNRKLNRQLEEINATSKNLNQWVKDQAEGLLKSGKSVAVVGGEHSVPLGLMEALSSRYLDFGILQIDAHMDLRDSYEQFSHSHASIMHHALKIRNLVRLTQVGIRDYCEEEQFVWEAHKHKINVFFDADMAKQEFEGKQFAAITEQIIATLPRKVYISFDIDGLDPSLCPNTGTPVPGGLTFQKASYLLRRLVLTGREIIGFDLCETAGLPHLLDGNVGARVLYLLSLLMAKSKGW